MLRSRGTGSGQPSRATAQTLCQKCLKRGHFSYECKVNPQERPYVSRPSRTQQLANPSLAPKLATQVHDDLLRKSGVADEELAKREIQRKRQGDTNMNDHTIQPFRRSNSRSSRSSSSVSTISTSVSRSPSPVRPTRSHTGNTQDMSRTRIGRKRRRSSSVMSYTSTSSFDQRDGLDPAESDSHIRKHHQDGRYNSRLKPDDRESFKSHERWKATQTENGERDKRRRHASRSPNDGRGRHREYQTSWKDRRTRSPNKSRDRSEVVRNRKSITPNASTDGPNYQERLHRPRYQQDGPKGYERAAKSMKRSASRQDRPRERSLSPFSKRLALTQAMNKGG